MCSSQSSSILTFTGPPDRFPRLLPQTRHFISHPTSSIYLLPTPFLSSQLFNHGRRTTCPRLYRPLRCLPRSGVSCQARVGCSFYFRQVSISQLLIWILRARFNDLATQYEAAFGTKPKYIARAPGRVKYVTVRLYPAFP